MKTFGKAERRLAMLHSLNVLIVILAQLVALSDGHPQLPRHTIRLYGNASLGYYYMNLLIGSPPQQQSVILDTGSGELALPCSKCTACSSKHIQTPYKMELSWTSKYVTCDNNGKIKGCGSCSSFAETENCRFSISFAEGSSISGIIISDVIRFEPGEGEEIRTTFGCTTRETNLFLTQAANGIFGLAPRRNSNLLEDIYQLHSPFSKEKFAFGLCLTGNGGILNIGQMDTTLHQKINSADSQTRVAQTSKAQPQFGQKYSEPSSVLTENNNSSVEATKTEIKATAIQPKSSIPLWVPNNEYPDGSKSIRTTYHTQKNLYSLDNVGDISIGGQVVHSKGQDFGYYGIFIDSGSTYSYFPNDQFLLVRDIMDMHCGAHSNSCVVINSQINRCYRFNTHQANESLQSLVQSIFPTIDYDINGGMFRWPPTKYFLLRSLTRKEVCLGIQRLDRYLLGSNFIVDVDVFFNMEAQTVDLFPGSQCLPNAVARISPFNFADADTVFEAVQHVYHENKHLLKALIGILCVVGAIIVALCILAGCDRYSSPSRDSHEEEERLSVRSVESNTGRSIEPNTGIHQTHQHQGKRKKQFISGILRMNDSQMELSSNGDLQLVE